MRKAFSYLLIFGGLLVQPALSQASEDSQQAITRLREYLAKPSAERSPWRNEEAFHELGLTKDDAALAEQLIWQDYATRMKATYGEDTNPGTVNANGYTMRYAYKVFGEKPAGGRSLYISLHGGGSAPPAVNEQQWHNQIGLYQPAEGIYLAPRAPTDAWDMWHQRHMDALLDQLITKMVITHDVNPDRVYLMGYSAGGDGVYQLAPRMADRWAAATAAAGHPNDASPLGLRNIGFSIHVGALDSSYGRNAVARAWQDKLAGLQAADPQGYVHDVQVHEGLGHWMQLRDAVAVPWMAKFTRNPLPHLVVWQQDDQVNTRFYWLGVEAPQAGAVVRARYDAERLAIDEAPAGTQLRLLLNDRMMDLDNEVVVLGRDGQELMRVQAKRTVATLFSTLEERGDYRQIYSAVIPVSIPQ